MKDETRRTIIEDLGYVSFKLWFYVFCFLLLGYLSADSCLAVTSKIARHSTGEDLLKGEVEDVVVSSRGTIQLGLSAKVLAKEFKDVWSINSIVVSGDSVFIGTSPLLF